jgi:lysophospholipase L1-like esterase
VRSFFYRLIAVILGFGIAFGLAEIGVRMFCPQETGPPRFAFDPVLGEIPVPQQKGRQQRPGVYDFTYSNNSKGFRGSREYGPKQPGQVRILLLGDSFTYGLGVNDDQTFGAVLERGLRAQHLDAEVINAGVPGKGTDYQLKFFQAAGAGLQPDLTVLCFFPNDFEDNARGDYFTVGPQGELSAKSLQPVQGGLKSLLNHFPGYNWLISWSQAANLVKQAMVTYLVKHAKGSGPAAAGLVVSYAGVNNFANEANRKLTNIYLAQLMEQVKQAGSRLLVVYIPLAAQVEAYRGKPEASPDEQALKEIIAARGGALLSLTPVLAAAPEPVGRLYYAEGHWTPKAHQVVGACLGKHLSALLGEQPK